MRRPRRKPARKPVAPSFDVNAWRRTIPYTTAFLCSVRKGFHANGNCSRNPLRQWGGAIHGGLFLPFPLDLQCTAGLEPAWRMAIDSGDRVVRPHQLFPRGFDKWKGLNWRRDDVENKN